MFVCFGAAAVIGAVVVARRKFVAHIRINLPHLVFATRHNNCCESPLKCTIKLSSILLGK